MNSPTVSHETMSNWAQALASGDEKTQVQALCEISNQEELFGFADRIVALAGDESDQVRIWAAEAMETTIQPKPSEETKFIDLINRSPDGEICYWATTMIGRLGSTSAAAIGTLEHCLLNSAYLAARERAVWALSQIGAPAIAALDSLQQVAGEVDHPRLSRLAGKLAGRLAEEFEQFQKRKGA